MRGGIYVAELQGGLLKFGASGCFEARSKRLACHAGVPVVASAWVGFVSGCALDAERLLLAEARRHFPLAFGREWFFGSMNDGLPVLGGILKTVEVERHPMLSSVRVFGSDAVKIKLWLMRQLRELVAV